MCLAPLCFSPLPSPLPLQVVNRIREVPHRTRLLVVDRDTDDFLRSQCLACTEDLAIEMGTLSPRPSPGPTPSASPIPRENSPLSPKLNSTHSFYFPAADPHTHTITQGEAERSSVTTSSKVQVTDSKVSINISASGPVFTHYNHSHMSKTQRAFMDYLHSFLVGEREREGGF